jgi:hypothetical protein
MAYKCPGRLKKKAKSKRMKHDHSQMAGSVGEKMKYPGGKKHNSGPKSKMKY